MAGGVYGFHNWRAWSGRARLIGGALPHALGGSRGRARRRSFAAMASSLLAKATAQLGRHRASPGPRGIESAGVRGIIGWGRTYCTFVRARSCFVKTK